MILDTGPPTLTRLFDISTAAVAKRVATLEASATAPERVDVSTSKAVRKAYNDGSLEIRPGY